MYEKKPLKRVLVVVSPDLVSPDAPRKSPLLQRALDLAKATGCELEIFHVCHDALFEQALFVSDADMASARKQIADREATLLAEMAMRLGSEGVTIHHDVRWDHPRTDAVLRKIDDSAPDLVMKQSREHSYLMGLTTNTDWDLVRRSPVHVWFVQDESSQINKVVTALGLVEDREGEFAALDYEAFRLAQIVADKFDAKNQLVHAYQVPITLAAHTPGVDGMSGAATHVPSRTDSQREIVKAHSAKIRTFVKAVGLESDDVRLVEGHPGDVLPEFARRENANLIVMSARNLSRWERFVTTVTAEPTLAKAQCDVLYIKEPEGQQTPIAAAKAVRGSVGIDLERAIVDPRSAFDSPNAVVMHENISHALKRRILQAWEQDIRAQMVEENEGGPVKETKADDLDAINSAQALLASQTSQCELHPQSAVVS